MLAARLVAVLGALQAWPGGAQSPRDANPPEEGDHLLVQRKARRIFSPLGQPATAGSDATVAADAYAASAGSRAASGATGAAALAGAGAGGCVSLLVHLLAVAVGPAAVLASRLLPGGRGKHSSSPISAPAVLAVLVLGVAWAALGALPVGGGGELPSEVALIRETGHVFGSSHPSFIQVEMRKARADTPHLKKDELARRGPQLLVQEMSEESHLENEGPARSHELATMEHDLQSSVSDPDKEERLPLPEQGKPRHTIDSAPLESNERELNTDELANKNATLLEQPLATGQEQASLITKADTSHLKKDASTDGGPEHRAREVLEVRHFELGTKKREARPSVPTLDTADWATHSKREQPHAPRELAQVEPRERSRKTNELAGESVKILELSPANRKEQAGSQTHDQEPSQTLVLDRIASVADPGAPSGTHNASVDLVLAILQTFFAVSVGITTTRVGLLQPQDVKAVSFLVGRVALPLIIFRATATMETGTVDLSAIAALAGAKLVIQLGTSAVAAAVSPRERGQRLLVSGMYGLFVTASEDFALGYPVVLAAFPLRQYPQNMVLHLAILAVVQAVVMNSIALTLLEAGKAVRDADRHLGDAATGSTARTVLLNTLHNPLLQMAVVGCLYRAVLGGTLRDAKGGGLLLPLGFHELVAVATSPFRFLAPFQLGLRLGSQRLAPWSFAGLEMVVLDLLKIVATPMLMLALLLYSWSGSAGNLAAFSAFALLVGSVPSSMCSVVVSDIYSVAVEVVPGAALAGLLAAGPVMFVSSMLFRIDWAGGTATEGALHLQCALQLPGLCCSALLVALFLSGGRTWCALPRGVFLHFALAVALGGATQIALLKFGCDVPLLVHGLRAFARQQTRLFGVALPLLGYCRERMRADLAGAGALCLIYVVSAALAYPVFQAHQLKKGPLRFDHCHYSHHMWEPFLDQMVCECGLLVIAAGLVYMWGKQDSGNGSVGGDLSQLGQRPELTAAQAATVQDHNERIQHVTRLHAGVGDHEFVAPDDDDEDTDEQWHVDGFARPAAAMGAYAALLLALELATARSATNGSLRQRDAASLLSTTAQSLQGVLLLVLFCYGAPARRIYAAAGAWCPRWGGKKAAYQ